MSLEHKVRQIIKRTPVGGDRISGAAYFGILPSNSASVNQARLLDATDAMWAGEVNGIKLTPGQTYDFGAASDAESAMLAIGCKLDMRGATVRFAQSRWPLIVATRDDCEILGGSWVNTGAYDGAISGSRTFTGRHGAWASSVSAHRFACAIAVLGGSRVSVSGGAMRGIDTTKNMNIWVLVEGLASGLPSAGVSIRSMVMDDACNSIMISGVTGYELRNIISNRGSQESLAHYGAGHVVYDVIERASSGIIDNIIDFGVDNGGSTTQEGHTLSLKNVIGLTTGGIVSSRCAGPLNWTQAVDCQFLGLKHAARAQSATNASNASVYYTGQGGASSSNRFDASVVGPTSAVNMIAFSMHHATNQPVGCGGEIRHSRTTTGSEPTTARIGGVRGDFRVVVEDDYAGTGYRSNVEFMAGADGNTVAIALTGRVRTARCIANSGAVNNKAFCEPSVSAKNAFTDGGTGNTFVALTTA